MKLRDPLLEHQWEDFQKENPTPYKHIDETELKERLIKELGYVSSMTVEEYTLYQKWCEVKNKYPAQTVKTTYGHLKILWTLKSYNQNSFIQKTIKTTHNCGMQ
jgi:hypothetical protein